MSIEPSNKGLKAMVYYKAVTGALVILQPSGFKPDDPIDKLVLKSSASDIILGASPVREILTIGHLVDNYFKEINKQKKKEDFYVAVAYFCEQLNVTQTEVIQFRRLYSI